MASSSAGCSYCNTDIYIKVEVFTKPILAPLTYEQELREKLVEMTGETYVHLQKNFCPMCGKRIMRGDKRER